MTLFLIRHASAGTRDSTDPRDDLRPLDQYGHAQANEIARHLNGEPITRVLSSPALRCQQTVEPLGQVLSVPVELAPALFEGSSTSRSIALIRELTGMNAALCSHGDVIPDLLRNLSTGGTEIVGRGCAKGSIWRLDNSTERIEMATYLGLVEPAQSA